MSGNLAEVAIGRILQDCWDAESRGVGLDDRGVGLRSHGGVWRLGDSRARRRHPSELDGRLQVEGKVNCGSGEFDPVVVVQAYCLSRFIPFPLHLSSY